MDLQSLLTLMFPVLLTTAAFFIIAAIVRWLSKLLKLPDHLRTSLEIVAYGPVPVALIGYGFYLMVQQNYLLYNFPVLLKPGNVFFFVELAFLLVAVSAGTRIGKLYVGLIGARPNTYRLLSLGLYSLGLMGLFYALFSSPISPGLYAHTYQALNFITGLIVVYIVVHIVNMVFRKYQSLVEGRKPSLQTILTFSRRILLAAVALIGVAALTFGIFPDLGSAVASLFIAAGFSSIVVGLAAQSTLSNIIAGVVVSSAQPFRIGDALSFKGEWAWVEDIRLTFTVLRTWDNRRLVVPNQLFLNDTLINYDLTDSSKLCIVYIQIPYEADVDVATKIMKECASSHRDFLPAGNLPVVHVMEYNQSGIQMRLLSRAKDQPTNFQMSKDLLYSIRKEFKANGIPEIGYPRREIVFRDGEEGQATGRTGGKRTRKNPSDKKA